MTHAVEAVHAAVYAHRRMVAMFLFGAITAASYACAYLLRFDFRVPAVYEGLLLVTVLPLTAVRLIVFRWTGLTRARWRYASGHSLGRLLLATGCGTAALLLLGTALPLHPRVPFSVLAIEGVLTSWLISAVWIAYRIIIEHLRRPVPPEVRKRRVLIVGAGEAGHLLAMEMLSRRDGYVPVGFVDDDPHTWNSTIHDIEVIGGTSDLPAIVGHKKAEEVLLALPSAEPADLRRIVARCEAAGVPFKVLPGVRAVFNGEVKLNQLREVQIEDLLGREPIQLELPELEHDLGGQVVLITGAAGSIGAELSRQVALHQPERLVLLDQAETDLFYLELELRERYPALEIVPIVGDVADRPGMERVFEQHAPARVFHAAAYKHVPMMELNAREAIRNNTVGTWRVAELAGQYGAEKFVLVSTDKAVRPTSVMGASKRMAELVILELQRRYHDTAYGAVRFGNVLGSQGSVIPVFKQQLAEGRPLTVTHPDMTRYFMTIPEAVQLILQASLLEHFRGRIAMLEMGEPVRILDLARNLLRLSGVTDGADRIVFIGIRPGEKLHEELSAADEDAEVTPVPKVRLLRTDALTGHGLVSQLNLLETQSDGGASRRLRTLIEDMFPDVSLAADVLTTLPTHGDVPAAVNAARQQRVVRLRQHGGSLI